MALGAQPARIARLRAPAADGRRPTGPHRLRNAAAAGCAPGRCAPHRVGAIRYATRSALQRRTQRPLRKPHAPPQHLYITRSAVR